MKGVVLFDLNNRDIFVSRNITHHEHIFPYQTKHTPSTWSYYPSSHDSNLDLNAAPPTPTPDNLNHNLHSTKHPILDSHLVIEPHLTIHNSDTAINIPDKSTKPKRQTRVPSYLLDYVCNSSSQSATSIISGTPYPFSNFYSYANLSSSHKAFSVSLSNTTEPKTYTEACKSNEWIDAMNSELEALHRNGTWSIIDSPAHIKPIGSKWVFKIKHKADGSIERYKARLVAKGYNQIEGLEFFDTFSPNDRTNFSQID
ncbi:retrovirus-related Pol polyprotein from transposon TNT 1-94 [Trifolium pratense]|uniref:Retrovirus-related Pol polyprotein from transposon TNT 1-94 n=1 Tax=Trifolium pratense TaxID=57577 RepID=A0A2K3MA34_TRIPR|nr:retrovirus-related Pol polyprotein from transposon TNT 1-94 [Trifolium pratense]